MAARLPARCHIRLLSPRNRCNVVSLLGKAPLGSAMNESSQARFLSSRFLLLSAHQSYCKCINGLPFTKPYMIARSPARYHIRLLLPCCRHRAAIAADEALSGSAMNESSQARFLSSRFLLLSAHQSYCKCINGLPFTKPYMIARSPARYHIHLLLPCVRHRAAIAADEAPSGSAMNESLQARFLSSRFLPLFSFIYYVFVLTALHMDVVKSNHMKCSSSGLHSPPQSEPEDPYLLSAAFCFMMILCSSSTE